MPLGNSARSYNFSISYFFEWRSPGADPDLVDWVEKPGQRFKNCILSDYYDYYFKSLQSFS